MKKFIVAITSIALLSFGSPAIATDQYSPDKIVAPPGSHIIQVLEESGVENVSSLQIFQSDQQGNPLPFIDCANVRDPKCDWSKAKDGTMGVATVFPVCKSVGDPACIVSLQITSADGAVEDAKFIKISEGGKKFPADLSMGMYEGSSPSLFQTAAANYVVIVKAQYAFNRTTKKFGIWDLVALVMPYREAIGDQYRINADGYGPNTCLYFEDRKCGVAQEFEPGIRVSLKMRLPKSIGGWFRGRLKSPNIVIQPESSYNTVSVSGEPIQVPKAVYVMSSTDFDKPENAYYKSLAGWGSESGMAHGSYGSRVEAFNLINRLRPLLNDTASGVTTIWSLATMPSGGGGPNCLNDTSKVLGLVTTNSMGFDGHAPDFVNGTLKYKVTGMHYMPNGTDPVLGNYDLVMRGDTARCLYGFSSAPVSASISVFGDKGEARTAVTTVKEVNGWLKMAAYGFSFSSPTISVKLTQASAKKTTIICVKGKLTKKVTAVGPKCPVGYKKS